MKRGFKAHAERESARLRACVGVGARDPLSAEVLAAELGVLLVSPTEIPGLDSVTLAVLQRTASTWSAVTLPAIKPPRVIYNPFHAPTRHESDVMHELAHLLCEHRSDQLIVVGGLPCRSFSREQEEEAAWMGATLQAPRVALVALSQRGLTVAQVALHLGCSEDLVRYRMNVTGIERQLGRRRWRPSRTGAS